MLTIHEYREILADVALRAHGPFDDGYEVRDSDFHRTSKNATINAVDSRPQSKMCGILATSREIEDIQEVIEFLKRRGPDATNHLQYRGISFVHTLLSMTGKLTIQPFIDGENDLVAFFNGEIYNYLDFGDYESDGQCILPLYREHGDAFVPMLDGEFALALFDFASDKMIVSTDIFSTKPLWMAIEGGDFALGSYESSILRLGFENPIQIEANTTIIFSISELKELERKPLWTFDLNQHKTDFDDWDAAFENAIRKRTRGIKHGIFIGLSSGYDSGAIACELNRQNVPFTSYSIVGSEDPETIKNRFELLENTEYIELTRDRFLTARDHLKKFSEEYTLRIDNGEQALIDGLEKQHQVVCAVLDELEPIYRELNDPEVTDEVRINRNNRALLEKRMARYAEVVEYRKTGQMLTDDNGAIGMSHICGVGRARGELIYISGSGADEIFSDYGFQGIKHFRHSTIGGHFIEDISKYFPWKNFFGNTQRAYLMKEEHVSGSHGVEGRYPFLDREVVQEFLWLSADLKNRFYKVPLHQYMAKHNFPFDICAKVGFNCGFSSSGEDYIEKISTERTVGETKDESLIVDFGQWGEMNPISR